MEKETKSVPKVNGKKTNGTAATTKKTTAKKTVNKKVEKARVKTVVKSSTSNEKKVTVKAEPKKENKKTTVSKKEMVEPKKENKKEKLVIENNELTKLLKIVLIVTAIVLVFYLVTYIVEKNNVNKKNKPEEKDVVIQYDEILLGNLLEQPNSEYLVLAYNEKDNYYSLYNSYLTSYKAKSKALRVYTSVLNNGFNRSYYDENGENNTNIKKISDLKLKETALFKIKNGKISKVYIGYDSISEYLKSITK